MRYISATQITGELIKILFLALLARGNTQGKLLSSARLVLFSGALMWKINDMKITNWKIYFDMWHQKPFYCRGVVLKLRLYVDYAFVFGFHLVLHVQRLESHLKLAAQFAKQQVVHPANRL